ALRGHEANIATLGWSRGDRPLLASGDLAGIIYIWNVAESEKPTTLRGHDRASSSPGEFHPQALTEPDGSLSAHPALIIQPLPTLSPRGVPPHRWVDPTTRPDDWAPSLQAPYRPFAATTRPSAPVLRIGTLALVGQPLELLP